MLAYMYNCMRYILEIFLQTILKMGYTVTQAKRMKKSTPNSFIVDNLDSMLIC